MAEKLTRSQAFAYYRCCKISYDDIDAPAIRYLLCLLDEQFAGYRKRYFADPNRTDPIPTLWSYALPGRSVRAVYDSTGGIQHCFIYARRTDGSITEAISFYDNKGISFAKDVDENDVQPVLQAFIEWTDWLGKRKYSQAEEVEPDEEDEEDEDETPCVIASCEMHEFCPNVITHNSVA